MAGTALLDRDFTPTVVTASGVETEVYRFVIPGGTLGSNRAVRLEMIGALQATPVAFVQLRALYGNTVLYSGGLTIDVDQGTERMLRYTSIITAAGLSTGQRAFAYLQAPLPDNVNTVSGTANLSALSRAATAQRWCSEDSTVDQPLFVTCQSHSPTLTLRALSATLEALEPGDGSVALLNVDTTQQVLNATALTDIYRFTVPGGTLGTTNALRLHVVGSRSATASHWMELQASYGGVVLFSGGDAANTDSADHLWSFALDLMGRGTALQQISAGRLLTGQGTLLTASGQAGDAFLNVVQDRWALQRWCAVDSTQDADVAIALRSSTDDQELRVHGAYLETLRPGTGGNQLLDAIAPDLLVSGTAATTVYAFTIPAGTLKATSALRFKVFGSQTAFLNRRLGIRALYGGITLFSGARSFGLPQPGPDRGWTFEGLLMPVNDSLQQQVAIAFSTPMSTSTLISASGQATAPANTMTGGHRWLNVDTTQDQPFLIALSHQTFDVFTRVHAAYLELLAEATVPEVPILHAPITAPQFIHVGPGLLWTDTRKPAMGEILLVSGFVNGASAQRLYGPLPYTVSGTFVGSTIGESVLHYAPRFIDIMLDTQPAPVDRILTHEEMRVAFNVAELRASQLALAAPFAGATPTRTLDPLMAAQQRETLSVGGLRLVQPRTLLFVSPHRRIDNGGPVYSYTFCGYNAVPIDGFDVPMARRRETVWRLTYELLADLTRPPGDQLFQFTMRQS